MSIFEKIWRKRGRPSNHEDIEEAENKAPIITETDRDYSELLESDDVAIKFWLPELMGTILDEICALMNTTRSDIIRQTLFTYLYGKYDLLAMYEKGTGNYQLNSPPLFSISEEASDTMRDMGKNIEDLKVFIPEKMKEDIQGLAEKAGITISEMIREIMISSLIGHSYLPARSELLQMEIEVEEST